MISDVIHSIYRVIGHIVCRCLLFIFKIRDKINPPKEESILFVAHPDDDALFFHSFIKKHKPYVVLLMTGWSLKRLPCFFRAMKYYGVKCRAYDLVSSESLKNDPKWYNKLKKEIEESLAIGTFRIVATHNSEGEYGHRSHKAVNSTVRQCIEGNIYSPVLKKDLLLYPLEKSDCREKEWIFKTIYDTEAWTIAELPEWMYYEHVEVEGGGET